MARIDTLENFLVDVATAIKEKRHLEPTDKMLASNFDIEIGLIDGSGDTSDTTAEEDDVLVGKTFYANNKKQIGTIPYTSEILSGRVTPHLFDNPDMPRLQCVSELYRLAICFNYQATALNFYHYEKGQVKDLIETIPTSSFSTSMGNLIYGKFSDVLNENRHLVLWMVNTGGRFGAVEMTTDGEILFDTFASFVQDKR